MRHNVREFVAAAVEAFQLAGPVYEFGSYLVEGQGALGDLRPLFPKATYVGCDLRPGPGVDRVEDLARLSLPDACAQTVICVDTLEHVYDIHRAVEEMIRILAPGGVLLLSAPMDFRIHDYPSDYWRLTPACVDRLLKPLAAQMVGSQGVESYPHTVMGIGCKAPLSATFLSGTGHFSDSFQSRLAAAAASAPWQRKWKRWMKSIVRGRGERHRARDVLKTRFILQTRVPSDMRHSFFEPHALGSTKPQRRGSG